MGDQPPEEAPAAADAPAPAPEAEAPAAEAPAAEETPTETRPSKSTLVEKPSGVSKSISHVRLVEPPQEQPAGEPERRPSEADRRRSEAERRRSEDRRKSEGTRSSKDVSTASHRGSQRPSTTSQSKEGILRRRSDRPSKSKAVVGSTISIRRASGYGESFGGAKPSETLPREYHEEEIYPCPAPLNPTLP